jgi:hypothetical protein
MRAYTESGYGAYLELGTSRMAARPYFAPAFRIAAAELARTQARIQSFSAQPPSGPEAESALQRLKRDEDALRRELARRPG